MFRYSYIPLCRNYIHYKKKKEGAFLWNATSLTLGFNTHEITRMIMLNKIVREVQKTYKKKNQGWNTLDFPILDSRKKFAFINFKPISPVKRGGGVKIYFGNLCLVTISNVGFEGRYVYLLQNRILYDVTLISTCFYARYSHHNT